MANEAEVFETGENMVTFGLEMPLERDLRYKIATRMSDSFRYAQVYKYTTHSLSGGPSGFQESDGGKLQAKRTKCETKEKQGTASTGTYG